ncbi:hypothetical protein CCUS01_04385 [Colletotrichum cuscutae]|uniref:Uncharacterized protein n=1 Tax=Colletotrichum cuscutae TaxID=1209917 RepID=A0AAI9Y7E0_9PEZI|nr:hypothetical protein CCUS01_04385 [Colletotrichum cuscutae]
MSTDKSIGSAQINVTQKVITANPRRVGAPWMKSEVQGTVGGSREGLTLVGAERHSRFDRGVRY